MRTRDATGLVVGTLTFLGGIALLLLTFRMAYELFQVPPDVALGVAGERAITLEKAGTAGVILLVRVFLLLVMCIVGSVICNRGIRLYQAAVGDAAPRPASPPKPAPPSPEADESAGP